MSTLPEPGAFMYFCVASLSNAAFGIDHMVMPPDATAAVWRPSGKLEGEICKSVMASQFTWNPYSHRRRQGLWRA